MEDETAEFREKDASPKRRLSEVHEKASNNKRIFLHLEKLNKPYLSIYLGPRRRSTCDAGLETKRVICKSNIFTAFLNAYFCDAGAQG